MKFQVSRPGEQDEYLGQYDVVVLAFDESREPFAAASSHWQEDRHVVAVHTHGDPLETGKPASCDILPQCCHYLASNEELRLYPHDNREEEVAFLARLMLEHLPTSDLLLVLGLFKPA